MPAVQQQTACFNLPQAVISPPCFAQSQPVIIPSQLSFAVLHSPVRPPTVSVVSTIRPPLLSVTGLCSPNSHSTEQHRDYLGGWIACDFCKAQRWPDEDKCGSFQCCHNGKVKLDPLREPPLLLSALLRQMLDSGSFLRNIRAYNCTLQMASTGVKIDTTLSGVTFMKAHDRIYHRIGSLLPEPNHKPKFAQIYMVDTDYSQDGVNATSHIPSVVSRSLLQLLKDMLLEHNYYVRVFRAASESNPASLY